MKAQEFIDLNQKKSDELDDLELRCLEAGVGAMKQSGASLLNAAKKAYLDSKSNSRRSDEFIWFKDAMMAVYSILNKQKKADLSDYSNAMIAIRKAKIAG